MSLAFVAAIVRQLCQGCRVSECLFCQIVNGEVRAKVLYEDDFVVSFDISKDHVSGSASASRKCSGG